jgi:molybdopterin converting factor small subunit
MNIRVQFYSYFKDLAGCAETSETLPEGATVNVLLDQLYERFPKLRPLRGSTLIAVGVEYQRGDYILKPGHQVSLFPPVQGG